MIQPNPDPNPTITAILALLDAASAIVQLPADTRRAIDYRTVQYLLDNAKALDRLLEDNRKDAEGAEKPPEPLGALRASAVDALLPTAQNGPKRHEKPARPPKLPATARTPVLPPVFPATTNGNGNDHAGEPGDAPADANDPPHPSNRLPFAEFDRLVRKEMKRLAMDGRLPGHKLWDSERTPPLPTLAAVILRYQANGLAGLAEALGLEPPLSVQKGKEPTL